ncbi:MAG: TolC family protein [Bacteroidota bacterium]
MNKLKWWGVLVMLCWNGWSGNPLMGQSPEDHLEAAAKENGALKAAFLRGYAALEKVDQTAPLPDPEVSFGVFVLPVETRVGPQFGQVRMMQRFPWMGTRKAQKAVVSEKASILMMEAERKKRRLFYEIRAAWYAILLERTKAEQLEKTKKVLEQHAQLATKKMEAGKGSMVNVLRVEMMISEMKMKQEAAEDAGKTKVAHFNALVGQPLNVDVPMPDSFPDFTDDFASQSSETMEEVQDSLAHHPDLQWLAQRQNALKTELEWVDKQGRPDISVGFNYIFVTGLEGRNAPENGRDAWMPTVGLKLPIHRKQYAAKRREIDLQTRALNHESNDRMDHLRAQTETALLDLRNASRTITRIQDQIDLSRLALRLLLKSYTESGSDISEALQMQQTLLQLELQRLDAQAQRALAYARFRELTGR